MLIGIDETAPVSVNTRTTGDLGEDDGAKVAAGGGSGDQSHKGGDPEDRHDGSCRWIGVLIWEECVWVGEELSTSYIPCPDGC